MDCWSAFALFLLALVTDSVSINKAQYSSKNYCLVGVFRLLIGPPASIIKTFLLFGIFKFINDSGKIYQRNQLFATALH